MTHPNTEPPTTTTSSTMPDLRVSEVRFVAASPAEQETGLIGWVSLLLDDSLRIDGVGLRRTLAGDLTISFPARKDRRGKLHPMIRPLSDGVRLDLQHRIFSALGMGAR